ncbi:MAG: NnrS family protein [Alphaproteobacteria bacterium]|nr:MAG: NnrS family protein [Alphaproteobacteria bacterium]
MYRQQPGQNANARRAAPHHVFFPAAALIAVLVVPLKVASALGMVAVDGLPPAWHGHEMLFGFAGAVMGGYLLNGRRPIAIAFALLAWLAGRVAVLGGVAPSPAFAMMLMIYPLTLLALAGWPMLRAAKSPRNAVFGLILAGFALAEGLYAAAVTGWLAAGADAGIRLAADVVLLLLFAMGGRIIAAASSGAHQQRGIHRHGLAQPHLERAGLVLLALMLGLDAAGAWPGVAALAAAGAGTVILMRLSGWRAWELVRARALFVLHLGYAWLGLGLILRLAPLVSDRFATLDALHLSLVGGLGTLAMAMMARVSLQRARRTIGLPSCLVVAIGLVALAAILRGLSALAMPDAGEVLLGLAAGAWGAAFLILIGWLSRSRF